MNCVPRTCARPGCDKPVEGRQTKYCCAECRLTDARDIKLAATQVRALAVRTCSRPGCGKPTPSSKHMYCCRECYKIKRRAGDRASKARRRQEQECEAPEQDTTQVAERLCLRCDPPRLFTSQWPGNRICGRHRNSDSVGPVVHRAHTSGNL